MNYHDILYARVRCESPDAVIANWHERWTGKTLNNAYDLRWNRDGTLANIQDRFAHYSSNEASNALDIAIQDNKLNSELMHSGVFGAFAVAVRDMLILDKNNECLCRFESVLDFRMLTHDIGPSLFSAAYMAYSDVKNGFKRKSFVLSPVIRNDNIRFQNMLSRGMAENHFHIGGSSYSFLSNWICLMNHVSGKRKEEFIKSGIDSNPLDNVKSVKFNSNGSSMYSLVFKAAYIRLFIYYRLHNLWLVTHKILHTDDMQNSIFNLLLVLTYNDIECEAAAKTLDSILYAVRIERGEELDYAAANEPIRFPRDMIVEDSSIEAVRENESHIFRYLCGEQYFLYTVFKEIYSNNKNIMPFADLIYAYVIIWCSLRGELVQTNRRVGFENFKLYQDRKDIFTESFVKYSERRTTAAIQSVICDRNFTSLEGRFIPSTNKSAMCQKIKWMNNCAFDGINKKSDESIRQKFHYVAHYTKSLFKPKNPMEKIENFDYELINCRCSELRKKVKAMTDTLISLRNEGCEEVARITGIDACANEIGCRPENFACDIRRICMHKPERRLDIFTLMPQIRRTYHVGEDFLDLADGLRAIDEAIKFCDMESGDRLGHALALGVDVEQWYSSKGYKIVLPKQDLLDDAVWMYAKILEYGITTPGINSIIEKIFNDLFIDVFRANMPFDAGHHSIDIYSYYQSMLLRGDDPCLYQDFKRRYYDVPKTYGYSSLKKFDSYIYGVKCRIALEPWLLPKFRYNKFDLESQAAELYYNYNFNPYLKYESAKLIEYTVPYEVIKVAAEIQERMRYEIADKKIGIECNPSSNYLIGTFRSYAEHPIIRFNDVGLFDSRDNPRMSVSINTDDAGVFDTCLENEYALLACAIESCNKYKELPNRIQFDNITRWLDNIRTLGIEQSFIVNTTN